MTRLGELNKQIEEANKAQEHDRAVINGMTFSINKLCELRASLETEVWARTKLILRLNEEAEELRL